MLKNNYIVFVLCLLAGFSCLPADAQRRSKKRQTVPKVTVEELFQNYRFEEAANLLHEKIENAAKDGDDTEELEDELRRANIGATMLYGTERVLFVDSVKVPAADFFKAIKLPSESGNLVTFESAKNEMSAVPSAASHLAYINELNDRMYFSMQREGMNVKNLCVSYRLRDKWGTPHFLSGLENKEDQVNPFVMPDGVTLYYAAKGKSSLGGYDLFVTRYDPSTNAYLKAENLGMPFNSLANDYMLVVDEANHLGWLVTDRNQSADTVCIYAFVPNESREVFGVETDRQTLVRAAKICSVKESHTDKNALNQARQRLLSLVGKSTVKPSHGQIYVINNTTLYTHLDQFRSETAKNIAVQADKVKEEIESMTDKYDNLTFVISQGTRNSEIDAELRRIKEQLPLLKVQYRELCKKMRIAESER